MERASEREREQGVERSHGQHEAAAADAASHPLLQLQRQLGNARVARLLQRVPPLEEETAVTTPPESMPTSETGQAAAGGTTPESMPTSETGQAAAGGTTPESMPTAEPAQAPAAMPASPTTEAQEAL